MKHKYPRSALIPIGLCLVMVMGMGMGKLPGVGDRAMAESGANSGNYETVDQIFRDYQLDQHVPGLVYGIVIDGRLDHVVGLGVQDLDSKRPVSSDSLFRIASMTKAFTALTVLKLRDEGRIQLDHLAQDYVPELKNWRYPTEDSPRIRVRHLLNHVAGFVTDDPWGDRQTPMAEAEFTALLRGGVPFTRPPAMAFEYSNLGYGILGRIITNVSKRPFEETITKTLITPLGMTSTGFDAGSAAIERRALGYRWEDNAWKPEPYLGPGAFGAMGGIQTNANDYGKWVAFLLSAWPPRDGKQVGPIDRASVRELAEGSNFPQFGQRPGHHATESCKLARNYGMGMIVARDCELGMTLYHSGGYPGYGSHLLLLPERGIGIFAFANRTYAAPSAAVWDAAIALNKAGQLPAQRSIPANADLTCAYDQIRRIYQTGNLDGADNDLAMNFLLDRDRAAWARELARLKEQAGDCDPSAAFQPTGALSADFTWRCAHGRVRGSFQLSPTLPPRIQQLDINILKP